MPKLATRKSDVVFRNAKARERPYQIADGGGLSLLVQPNGSKLWLFRYRRPATGRDNLISLGPYVDLTPTEARLRASALRIQVRNGVDPVEQRRADKAAIKRVARGPFQVVANDWLDFKRSGWAEKTYRNAEYVVNEYLVPALRDRPITAHPEKTKNPMTAPSANFRGCPRRRPTEYAARLFPRVCALLACGFAGEEY